MIWFLLLACKVTDAPDNVEELVVYGFEHFEDEPRFLRAMGAELFPWVDDHFDEMEEGWRVETLTEAHLEAAGVEDPEIDGVLGALAAVDYRHGVDAVLPVILDDHKAELFDHILAFEVLDQTDKECFLSRECDTYERHVRQTARVTLLGEATQEIFSSWRWIESEDGTAFLVERTLAPDPITFSTNIVAVDQQYALVVLYPWEGHGRRSEAFWVESRVIGADVPDSFGITQAANSIVEQADRIDDHLDGQ